MKRKFRVNEVMIRVLLFFLSLKSVTKYPYCETEAWS